MKAFDLFEDDAPGLDVARITQQSLVDTQKRMGAVLEALPVGLLIHTQQGIIYANSNAADLLQTSPNVLKGKHILDHVAPEDGSEIHSALERAFLDGEPTLTVEAGIDRSDGSRRLAKLIIGRLPWPGIPVLQIILQDVTDQKHAEASLRQLSITDELTGAYNRRHAFYEGALYVGQGAGIGPPFSVIMLDIDHFKHVNDTFGHPAGDKVLFELTRLVQGLLPSFRDSDSGMFARIGGEEFVVLLPGVHEKRATEIAERLRRAIASLEIETKAAAFRVTASMGVATRLADDVSFETIVGRADAALYAAKHSGRDCVVAFSSTTWTTNATALPE